MGQYLKLFQTHAQYTSYINGEDVYLPNVSYCENNNDVHYNPYVDPRLIVRYTVEDASVPTRLYYYYVESQGRDWVRGIDMFEKIEIDSVEVSVSSLDTEGGYYQLSVGEHTVVYTLKDPTTIANRTFSGCYTITSVTIPSSVTTICGYAFDSNSFVSVEIPNSVTTIESFAFQFCSWLEHVTIANANVTIECWAFQACIKLDSETCNLLDSINPCAREDFD